MGMRGFVSFALVLAMLFPLLMVAGSFRKSQESISQNAAEMASATRFSSAGEESRSAFLQVLRNSLGKGRLRQRDASIKLEKLEKAIEGKFAAAGFDADVWFGIASDEELQALAGKMITGRKAVKCRLCHDFSRTSADYAGEMEFYSSAFLFDGPNGIEISRKSFSEFPESTALAAFPFKAHFGISLNDGKLGKAAVILMDEGFG